MYKDKEKQKEAVKDAVAKHRRGITDKGITSSKPQGITLLKRPNGADYNPAETLPGGQLRYMGPFSDGQPRYMGPFSDGQVLDRLTCKQVDNVKPAPIRRCTIVNKVPSIVNAMVDTNKRDKLDRICSQLQAHATLSFIDGKFKPTNCLSMVNYGIGGPDMGAVAEMLEVTG